MGLYKIGRFLSVDPLFEMYTEFSPYNYCNNSPMMFRDPSGMGMEIALVGLGMIIYKYTADMIREAEYSEYGRVPNSAVPGGRIGDGGGGGNGVVTLASTRELAAANSNAAQFGGGNETMFSFFNPYEPVTINGPVGGRDAVVNSPIKPDRILKTPNNWSVESLHLVSQELVNELIDETENDELGFFWVYNEMTKKLIAKSISKGIGSTWITLTGYSPYGLVLDEGDRILGYFHTHLNHSKHLKLFQFSEYDFGAFIYLFYGRSGSKHPIPNNLDMMAFSVGTDNEISYIGISIPRLTETFVNNINEMQEGQYIWRNFRRKERYTRKNGLELLIIKR